MPSLYTIPHDELVTLQQAFGYTDEDLKIVIGPMAMAGEEPVGSMGIDIPLAVLSPPSRRTCSATSSSTSRRSPIRRSTLCAKRS